MREGIAKHSGPIDVDSAPEFAEYEPKLLPPLEAQLIDLVDEIAYNHHDIDDGLESGLLEAGSLADAVPLFREHLDEARRRHPGADARQSRTAALRGLIDELVSDLIDTTREALERSAVVTVADVRAAGRPLAGLSPRVADRNRTLKTFLASQLYGHPRIERMKDKARRILEGLLQRYRDNPALLPRDTQSRVDEEGLERAVADYIAGMTDRFAIEEYRRLHDPGIRV